MFDESVCCMYHKYWDRLARDYLLAIKQLLDPSTVSKMDLQTV